MRRASRPSGPATKIGSPGVSSWYASREPSDDQAADTAVSRKGRSAPPLIGTRDTLASAVRSATRIQRCVPSCVNPMLRTSSLNKSLSRPFVRFVNCPLPSSVTNASKTPSRSERNATCRPSAEIAASTSEPGKSVRRSIRISDQRLRNPNVAGRLQVAANDSSICTMPAALCQRSSRRFSRHRITRSTRGGGAPGALTARGGGTSRRCAARMA